MYRIPVANVTALRERIEKANTKAAKLGVLGLSFAEIAEEKEYWAINLLLDEHRKVDANYQPKWGERLEVRTYKLIEISGATPKFQGWEFIATINHGKYSTVKTIPGVECPAEQRERGNICDHCKINRYRSDTFVIRNSEGKYKQVGRTCIADYLGSLAFDPANIGNWFSYLHKLESEFVGFGSYPKDQPYYEIRDVLTVTAKSIHVSCWLSRGAARDKGGKATADTVVDYLSGYMFLCQDKWAREEREALQKATYDEKEIHEAIAWAQNLEGKSDYERNIKLMATVGSVKESDFGFVASILPVYRRTVTPLADKTNSTKSSEWIGREGEKIELKVSVLNFRELQGNYGMTILYAMNDENGNVIKWFTGKTDLVEGSEYVLKATVKRHGEYNGKKETLITRAKVV